MTNEKQYPEMALASFLLLPKSLELVKEIHATEIDIMAETPWLPTGFACVGYMFISRYIVRGNSIVVFGIPHIKQDYVERYSDIMNKLDTVLSPFVLEYDKDYDEMNGSLEVSPLCVRLKDLGKHAVSFDDVETLARRNELLIGKSIMSSLFL